jgi:hypothetical protein
MSTAPSRLITRQESAMFRDFLGAEYYVSDYPDEGLIPMPGYEFLQGLNYGNIRAFLYTVPGVQGQRYDRIAGSVGANKIPGLGLKRLAAAGLIEFSNDGDRTLKITSLGNRILGLVRSKELYHLPLGVHPSQLEPATEKDLYGKYFYQGSISTRVNGQALKATVTTNFGKDKNGKLRKYASGISSPKDDFIVEFANVPYDKKNFGKTVSDLTGTAQIYEDKKSIFYDGGRRLEDTYNPSNPDKVRLKPVAYGHHLYGGLYCLEGRDSLGNRFYLEASDKVVNYFLGKYGDDTEIYIPSWRSAAKSTGGSIFFVSNGKLVGINLKTYEPSQEPDLKKLYVPNAGLKKITK